MFHFISKEPIVSSNRVNWVFATEVVSFTGYCLLNPKSIGYAKIISIHFLGRLAGNFFGQQSAVLTNQYLRGSFTTIQTERTGRVYGKWIGAVASVLTYTYIRYMGYGEAAAIIVSASISSISASMLGGAMVSCHPHIYTYDLENPPCLEVGDHRAMGG